MADLKISELPLISGAAVQPDKDFLPLADSSASETKKVTPTSVVFRTLSIPAGSGGLPDGTIDPDKIDWSGLDPDTINGEAIKDATLDGASLVAGTVGNLALIDADIDAATKLQDNSIAETKYGPLTVSTRALADGSVNNAKLALGAAADNIAASDLLASTVTGDAIKVGTLDGDRLKDLSITSDKFTNNSINAGAKVVDNSILETKYGSLSVSTRALADAGVTAAKLAPGAAADNIGVGALDGATIADGTISNAKLQPIQTGAIADGAVTGAKIGVNAVAEGNIASGAIENRHLNSNAADPDGGLTVSVDGLGITNTIVAGSQAGINYNEHGLVTGVAIDGLVPRIDLPLATDTAIGAVSVPSDGGLKVSGTGELRHQNDITAGSFAGITFNTHGEITSTDAGGKVPSAYLPTAGTDSATTGAVYVPTQEALRIEADGAIYHENSGVSPGTFTKVTVNETGHVFDGGSITQADLPGLDADAITTGQFGTNRILDNSITAAKMTDYSTCLMQEDFPGSSSDYFLGMLWWQPSTAQLRVYSRGSAGNQWSPVGFGALQANNLRWGGVFDAATGTVSIVTDFGTTAGLTAGGAIPAPSNDLSGLYLICQTEGSNVNQPSVESDTFTPGDWLLCINETEGYIQIDAGASGGGGGGSSYLSQLLDVSLSSLKEGERLQADASGIWSNTDVMDGGTF